MGKRANNEGSIYKRKDGRWTATLSVGNRKRKAFYGDTRAEVAKKLTTALKAKNDGLPIVADKQTVSHYLDSWLSSIRASLRPRTWQRYEEYVRLHAAQSIGRMKLSRVTPQDVAALYAERLAAGKSPSTVSHLHAVLHKAFGQAVKWDLVARNVVDAVQPPRAEHKEMKTLSVEQAQQFLEYASGERLEALYVLAITGGMRQGELLALRWSNVDLDNATLQVTATLQRSSVGPVFAEPKTPRSRRQVLLSQAAVSALRLHKTMDEPRPGILHRNGRTDERHQFPEALLLSPLKASRPP